MKLLLSLCAIIAMSFFSTIAEAKGGRGGNHSVRGYIKKNGTYVAPHRATNPNGTRMDNWSTRGNFNPYTGKAGTRSPF
jgi:hypothetical protein